MIRVAILVFDQVDLLDVGGPYEVFLTADRLARRQGRDPLFDVQVVSPDDGPVRSYGGMGLIPTTTIDALGALDVAVIPGAIAIEEVAADRAVARAVAALVDATSLAASVCTGAFLLGDRGLLADIDWTTHFEDVADLAHRIGSNRGRAEVRWVDAGSVVTSGGLSSGLAMTLHLVDRLVDRELAEATATQLDYNWDPDAGVALIEEEGSR